MGRKPEQKLIPNVNDCERNSLEHEKFSQRVKKSNFQSRILRELPKSNFKRIVSNLTGVLLWKDEKIFQINFFATKDEEFVDVIYRTRSVSSKR